MKSKMHNGVNPNRLQHQHNVAEVGSLDLGDCSGKHLVLESIFGV
jgi:hypothetical protein